MTTILANHLRGHRQGSAKDPPLQVTWLDADFTPAERSDRLADALDYRAVADIIVEIGEGEPHRLIESLARRMVESLAERYPTTAITLELRKLSPAGCAGQPRFAAYRIEPR
jgi:dihydroneopterin aldolase